MKYLPNLSIQNYLGLVNKLIFFRAIHSGFPENSMKK